MIVAELIERLKTFPSYYPVVIPGMGSNEGGYADIENVQLKRLAPNLFGLKYVDGEVAPADKVIYTVSID